MLKIEAKGVHFQIKVHAISSQKLFRHVRSKHLDCLKLEDYFDF